MSGPGGSREVRSAFVHYCAFCRWHREGASPTILSHGCERCGCALASCTREQYEQLAPSLEDNPFERPRARDNSGMLSVVLVAVFLLPALGVKLGELVFLAPFVVILFAGIDCAITARLRGPRRGVWTWLIASAALAAGASLLAVLSAVAGDGTRAAFYLGAGGSAGLLIGLCVLARHTVLRAPMERLVDGTLVSVVVVATGLYFIALKGFARGDVLLTVIFLIDLAAASVGILCLAARPSRRHRRVAGALIGVGLAAAGGDGLVAAAAAHQIASNDVLVALFWTLAGFLLGAAAEFERAPINELDPQSGEELGKGWIWMRIALPLGCVLVFPAIALGIALLGSLTTLAGIYFGVLFVASLVIAFGRQAYLIVDNGRAVVRERRLRADAVQRNQELEALTGLASTMTESLEEAPIMERGLAVLHLAARSTSSALHARGHDGLSVCATAGDWQTERVWVTDSRVPAQTGVQERAGRVVARLPLSARGNEIGLITLIRGAGSPFSDAEMDLLQLLAGQLSIAVQNARDYCEKLDQAIRDPLTGVYNRRFFYESLDKELHRAERYGSEVSIVLLDIDNFKTINDSLGHGAGDDALRRVADVAAAVLRPTDSFARLGGEEFGLLLPETNQLDALLVAERLRTAVARNNILPDRRVTVSGGVSSCPKDALELGSLVKQADAALYWAKRNGKNICAIAGEVDVDSDQDRVDTTIAHLHAMVSAIDAQHLLTKDHSENVASYAVALGQALQLEPEEIVKLRRAALLHDIGKSAVSRTILEKPATLTDEEFEEIKLHPAVGATMLTHSGLVEEALWVRHHHERMDGRGYPDGLAGEAIPFESRILHIVDAFEAMTSDRPYHKAIKVSQALEELERCAGTQFDASIVAAMRALVTGDKLTILATTR
jgi:diguanylate cyclase (GGDEF)-like protein/putative nucleotidyltransferase with HDIG domain